jgi:GT2 family glycosyltransferase
MKLSICIPTHERHALLEERCLPSLLRQARLPDEIVVADSSTGAHFSEFYERWTQRFRPIKFTYVRTEGRSVVRNRWMAFSHSSADLVFFVDDDMQLTENATAAVQAVFEAYPEVTGVGLKIYYEGPPQERSAIGKRFRIWWLGNATDETNSISPGGRSTFGKDRVDTKPIAVQWLAGGAMCFRREALLTVGPLPGIDDLFRLRISASADTVLSSQVGLCGRLMLLTQPLAWHPERRSVISIVASRGGWRRGLRDSFGRAHVLRWLARDKSAVMHEWFLSTTLEYLRTTKAVLEKPFSTASWLRLLGFFYGCLVTLVMWRRIPDTPDQAIGVNRKWLLL